MDICAKCSKFICLLQVGAICLQYSHDELFLKNLFNLNAKIVQQRSYTKLYQVSQQLYCIITEPST